MSKFKINDRVKMTDKNISFRGIFCNKGYIYGLGNYNKDDIYYVEFDYTNTYFACNNNRNDTEQRYYVFHEYSLELCNE